MIYKAYGKTGLKLSAVGFGGMRFDTSKPDEQNAELLPYAFEKGINYFDTAPGYCDDKSEQIFGIALKQMAAERQRFYVSTKAMPTLVDTADKAQRAVEKSLVRLNLDKIDVFHVWCVRRFEQYEMAMKKNGLYEGLLACKSRGLIDHIAISTHLSGEDVKKIIAKNEFEGVLLGVNILNFRYRWQGVRAAYDAGMGVVAMNPLAGGVIPQNEKALAFLASDGQTVTHAALRFCMSCPEITVTLNGFTTKEHIDTACRVADNCTPFVQADIDRITVHISEKMNVLCTACGYCLGLCPENIPVQSFMQCYNDKLLPGKTDREMMDLLRGQYEWGPLADRKADACNCIQCRKCENACTQHLNIIERLAEIARWEKELNKPIKRLGKLVVKAKNKAKRLVRRITITL